MTVYKIEYNTPDDWDDMVLAKDKDTADDIKEFLESHWCFNIRISEEEVFE